MTDLNVTNQDGVLLVDSRDIAEMTDKRHDNLMRDIDGYVEILKKSTSSNLRASDFFIEGSYLDGKGETRRKYWATKKGCDMVANKMTGEKGVLFTAVYVTKFEAMEQQIAQIGFTIPSYMLDDPRKRAMKWIEEYEEKKQLETQKLMLEQRVAEYEPKVSYVDQILKSKSTVTTTQIAKDYGLTAKELNDALHDEKIQFKQNGQWLLYKKYADQGLTKSQTIDIFHRNGDQSVKMNTRWTQKGRLFIHELLQTRGIQAHMDREVKDAQ